MKRVVLAAALLAGVLSDAAAAAITREEVMAEAKAYAIHQWRSTSQNQTASCSSAYKSLFPPGDYVGLPYGWGGYMSLFTFDQGIKNGLGAGAQEPDGILECIAGVDCSGFVSMAWATSRYTTSTMSQAATQIAQADLLAGDVFNKAGYHVALFSHLLSNGSPSLIEAVGYNTHFNSFGGWSYVSGYTPRRFTGITGTTAANPVGTSFNPIVIGSLPYSDTRSTAQSPQSAYDGCGAAASTPEKGPEYVYKIDVTTPGTLTVTVTDDAVADIDLYLLETLNTTACKARGDTTISQQVGCGTYWIVADTYGTNASKAGQYTLNATLTPSGQACGAVAGPPAFSPKGKLGDACAYPGDQSLPFCNSNLGSETCIYGSSASFCSKGCAQDSDCGALGSGACCEDLGKGEKYCMTKSFCGAGGSSGATTSSGSPGTSSGDPSTSGGEPGTSVEEGATAEEGTSAGGGPKTTTTTTGGCGLAVNERGASPWAVVLGALGLAATIARRRRG